MKSTGAATDSDAGSRVTQRMRREVGQTDLGCGGIEPFTADVTVPHDLSVGERKMWAWSAR